MSDIIIPPAALEAGEAVVHKLRFSKDELAYADDIARACFLAILEAWPNRVTVKDDGRRQTYIIPAIILPLPKGGDDE